MKTETKTATIETAYGEKLDAPIELIYEYEKLEASDTIPADEVPSEKDIRQFVNGRRNASARAAATSVEFSKRGIKAPTLEDPAVQLRTMIKVLVAAGKTAEQAEQIARATLGL